MKLFLQKNAKFSRAGGYAPRPPKQPSPLRISGYAPDFHCLFWTCTWSNFLHQLTTITRCLVFFIFGLYFLALCLSPFALGLKYEVGVWVKLIWWALLLHFTHSMHRLWFRVVQLLQMSLCASFCACRKNKLLLLANRSQQVYIIYRR